MQPMSSTGLAVGETTVVHTLLVRPAWLPPVLTAPTSLSLLTAGPGKGLPWRGRGGCKNPLLACGKLESLQHPQKSPRTSLEWGALRYHSLVSCQSPRYLLRSLRRLRGCPLPHSHFLYVCDASIWNQEEASAAGCARTPGSRGPFFSQFQPADFHLLRT